MQSSRRARIFRSKNLTGSFSAHSRHSNCWKNDGANGGSRPIAVIREKRTKQCLQLSLLKIATL